MIIKICMSICIFSAPPVSRKRISLGTKQTDKEEEGEEAGGGEEAGTTNDKGTNKPVFGVSDHVQHKPGCTTTRDS